MEERHFIRLLKADSDVEFSAVKADWDENFSKKESWRRAEATRRELIKEFDSNEEKCKLMEGFIRKIRYGDARF